ncbi:MAG: hypothetical protein ACTHQQ_24575 [Solirubrobacteraceae bacterium]
MPSRRKQSGPYTPAEIAALVKSNPYLQRVVLDAKLRDNMRTAAGSVRNVYDRISNHKVSARSLLEDKKAQADLRKALENLRDVTLALTAPPKKRKLRVGRVVVLVGVGSGAALAASEKLRSKVLDLLFGAEEEFQYTPPPSTAPPATPPAADADAAEADASATAADAGATPDADTATATGTQTGSAPGSA